MRMYGLLTCVRMYACMYVGRYVGYKVYECMHGCMYVRTYVCMYACMYACNYMHVCHVCLNVCGTISCQPLLNPKALQLRSFRLWTQTRRQASYWTPFPWLPHSRGLSETCPACLISHEQE